MHSNFFKESMGKKLSQFIGKTKENALDSLCQPDCESLDCELVAMENFALIHVGHLVLLFCRKNSNEKDNGMQNDFTALDTPGSPPTLNLYHPQATALPFTTRVS